MIRVQDVCDFLESFAPSSLAEDWDNVGLLVGRADREVRKIMTCLTITKPVVDECVAERADLIVTHHPLPFHPTKRLTASSTSGDLLLTLIEGRVAVHSPHTAFDSTSQGINQSLAEILDLRSIRPLIEASATAPADSEEARAVAGSGRLGECRQPSTLQEIVDRLKGPLSLSRIQWVGGRTEFVRRVAVACGSGGSFLEQAARQDCDLFVTGEMTFHTVLEGQSRGIALLLVGHYASERFAVERLADRLAGAFPSAEVWASRRECDPLDWI